MSPSKSNRRARFGWIACLAATGLVLAIPGVAPAADQEVGAGKPFATIGAAIAASTAGVDRVVVYDGTYNEQVVWDRAVDIVAAPGQNPVLLYNGGSNDVIVVAYVGSARWDGIDVTLDKTILGGTIFFILRDSTTQVTLENFTFSDTENASGNPKTFFCHGGCLVNINNFTYSALNSVAEAVFFVQVGSKLVANGCTLNGISDKHTWINQAGPDPTKITINDSVLTKPDAGGHLVMVFHGEVEVNDSDLVLDGGASRGIITLNSGQAQKISVNRSVLDGTRVAGGRLVNIENALTDITFTNSALVLRADSFGIFGGLGGTVTMVHSTMSAPHHVGNRGIVGPENPGVTLDVTLDNNVFSLPGSNRGVVHDPALGGTLTVTAGTNLRWLADGTGAATDALTGQGEVIDADPKLDADSIHILASSPAINAAEDLGVLDDIDGEPRPGVTVPASSLPDLGADEFSGDLPLSPPTILAAEGADASVVLSWSVPSGSGPPVEGYNVYRTSPGDRTKLNEDPVTETIFAATGLENGVEACFVVRSVGGDLESEDSNEACATPVASGGLQLPGDCTQNGTLDISDPICLLGHLFLGSPEVLPCDGGTTLDPGNLALLDSNGDADIDLSDPVHVLGYLFLGSGPPVGGTECRAIPGCPDACTLIP